MILPYSYETVKTFLDFLYLGPQEFLEKLSDHKEFSVFELLDLAHTYQIEILFNCCLHIINDSATFNNLKDIQAAAKLYLNKDLNQITESLELNYIKGRL